MLRFALVKPTVSYGQPFANKWSNLWYLYPFGHRVGIMFHVFLRQFLNDFVYIFWWVLISLLPKWLPKASDVDFLFHNFSEPVPLEIFLEVPCFVLEFCLASFWLFWLPFCSRWASKTLPFATGICKAPADYRRGKIIFSRPEADTCRRQLR